MFAKLLTKFDFEFVLLVGMNSAIESISPGRNFSLLYVKIRLND